MLAVIQKINISTWFGVPLIENLQTFFQQFIFKGLKSTGHGRIYIARGSWHFWL